MVNLERPHKVIIIITFFSSSDNVYVRTNQQTQFYTAYANTEYGKGWKMQVSNSSRDKRFSFVRNVQFGSGAHPFNGSHGLCTGKTLPGREGDHSPRSSAEVESECSFAGTPLMCLHGTYRDNFTFQYTASL
jgi:hypothetical protein